MKKISFSLKYNYIMPLLFIVISLAFIIFTPKTFLSPNNLIAIGRLTPDIGIVTLGIGILMISGEFDLSIGSIIALCSYIYALFITNGVNPIFAFIILLPIGIFVGFINGIIIVKTGLPSFIITLSMMMFWRGIVYSLSDMAPINIKKYIESNIVFKNILVGRIYGIPIQFLWFILISVILGLFLHFHKFGNWIYSIGNSNQTARAMGIKTGTVKVSLYMLVGFLCAFVAVLQALRLDSFNATQGINYEFLAVAGAVLGGTALTGGVGNMLNIFLGVLTVRILTIGMILIGAPVYGIDAFIGAALIFFASLYNLLGRKKI
jgi:simple sugar transport system permease protein